MKSLIHFRRLPARRNPLNIRLQWLVNDLALLLVGFVFVAHAFAIPSSLLIEFPSCSKDALGTNETRVVWIQWENGTLHVDGVEILSRRHLHRVLKRKMEEHRANPLQQKVSLLPLLQLASETPWGEVWATLEAAGMVQFGNVGLVLPPEDES